MCNNNPEIGYNKNNWWVEFFDTCENCGKPTGMGHEGWIYKETVGPDSDLGDNDTIHLCDTCLLYFANNNELPSQQKGTILNRGVSDGNSLADTNRPADKYPETLEGIQKAPTKCSIGNADAETSSLHSDKILQCVKEELDNYNFTVLEDYPKSNFIDTLKRIKELYK